jgi:hypothetical protein
MSHIKIHANETEIRNEIASIHRKSTHLQKVYDLLIEMGGTSLDVDDLKSVYDSEGNPVVIKALVMKGKDLRLNGIKINSSAFELNESDIRAIKSLIRSSVTIHFDQHEIKDGKVIIAPGVDSEVARKHTLLGTEKTKAVIESVDKIAKEINAVLDQIGGVHNHHPARDFQNFLSWNPTTKQFTADLQFIARIAK